jgi:hypothetical protein
MPHPDAVPHATESPSDHDTNAIEIALHVSAIREQVFRARGIAGLLADTLSHHGEDFETEAYAAMALFELLQQIEPMFDYDGFWVKSAPADGMRAAAPQ